MKATEKIGWVSAWLGIASWVLVLLAGTISMSEGGMAFIGTAIMLVLYAGPVTCHFLAIWLALRKGIAWLLLLAAGLWVLLTLFTLLITRVPPEMFGNNPPPPQLNWILYAIASFFLLEASAAVAAFASMMARGRRTAVAT